MKIQATKIVKVAGLVARKKSHGDSQTIKFKIQDIDALTVEGFLRQLKPIIRFYTDFSETEIQEFIQIHF